MTSFKIFILTFSLSPKSITFINAMSITATSILTITNLYAPLCDEGAPDHHHQFHHHHCLLQHHHQWCHQSFKQQIIHYLPYIMLGEFENDRNLNCSSRHVPLPRLAWPPLLPHQGEVNTLTLTFYIDKTLTLTWTRHWQDIDKALTRLLHRPEHRPLPALRVHLETDYVGLPRLAHPASSVDHDCGPVQVVLVVIKTMI